MSAAQFTPGPWQANLPHNSDGSLLACHVVTGEGAAVAQLAAHNDSETAANARLIASAPELYRTLGELLELVMVHGLEPCRDFEPHEFDAIVDGATQDARKALAKAVQP